MKPLIKEMFFLSEQVQSMRLVREFYSLRSNKLLMLLTAFLIGTELIKMETQESCTQNWLLMQLIIKNEIIIW